MINRPNQRLSRNFLGPILLALPALLALILISHHPVYHGDRNAAAMAAGMHALAPLDRFIHGGLIAMFGLQSLGFYLFSERLGWTKLAVIAGFMSYSAGIIIITIPVMLDGFVTPDLVATCATADCAATLPGALQLAMVMVQEFTKLAIVAVSLGIFAWSLVLVGSRNLVNRATGFVGLICGLCPPAILLFADLHLSPNNLVGVVAPQLLWSVTIAAWIVNDAHSTRSNDHTLARIAG